MHEAWLKGWEWNQGRSCGFYERITPFSVRRAKARSFSGCEAHPANVAPAGSNRSSRGGDEAAEAFDVTDPLGV